MRRALSNSISEKIGPRRRGIQTAFRRYELPCEHEPSPPAWIAVHIPYMNTFFHLSMHQWHDDRVMGPFTTFMRMNIWLKVIATEANFYLTFLVSRKQHVPVWIVACRASKDAFEKALEHVGHSCIGRLARPKRPFALFSLDSFFEVVLPRPPPALRLLRNALFIFWWCNRCAANSSLLVNDFRQVKQRISRGPRSPLISPESRTLCNIWTW